MKNLVLSGFLVSYSLFSTSGLLQKNYLPEHELVLQRLGILQKRERYIPTRHKENFLKQIAAFVASTSKSNVISNVSVTEHPNIKGVDLCVKNTSVVAIPEISNAKYEYQTNSVSTVDITALIKQTKLEHKKILEEIKTFVSA